MVKSYNIRFPLVDDPTKNNLFQLNSTTKDAYSSDLLLLLVTQKGERYYMSDYGTNLIKFIFEPNDNVNESDIEQEIKVTVKKWIPSLTINNVKFFNSVDENSVPLSENELQVLVSFVYEEDAFSETGVIQLNF